MGFRVGMEVWGGFGSFEFVGPLQGFAGPRLVVWGLCFLGHFRVWVFLNRKP